MHPRYEVAAVIERFGHTYTQEHQPNSYQLRTLRAIRNCRTAYLGGHVDTCTHCGHVQISYNSCRNRHCPKCQGEKREQWIQQRSHDLIPVPYYHVVFTLPQSLNQLCLHEPAMMYDLLFKSAWNTLYTFALDSRYMGAFPGMVAVLHTWGQTLSLHPHLHCLVPAGGVSLNKHWIQAKYKGMYLFPVQALSAVFRGKYIDLLKRACKRKKIELSKSFVNELYRHSWVVYCKQPYKSVFSVLEYLGRYTHRIAISNHRIKSISEKEVVFTYKDYRDQNKRKEMTLSGQEFLRRFVQHILPKGFVRIRHYGFLSPSQKKVLRKIQQQLGVNKPTISEDKHGVIKQIKCPKCGSVMIRVEINPHRGPPVESASWRTVVL